jgi:hypothetical protein
MAFEQEYDCLEVHQDGKCKLYVKLSYYSNLRVGHVRILQLSEVWADSLFQTQYKHSSLVGQRSYVPPTLRVTEPQPVARLYHEVIGPELEF